MYGEAENKHAQKGTTLFVGNISCTTTKDDLQAAFTKIGLVNSVRLPLHEDGENKSK
jgi:RNA recognition motif-containing protein